MEWLLGAVFLAGVAWLAHRAARVSRDNAPYTPPSDSGAQDLVASRIPPAATPPAEIELATSQFSLAWAIPAHIKGVVEFPESSTSRVVVYADLGAQTCTCAAFVSRSNAPKDQFGRWCRHLVQGLADAGAFSGASEWHQAMATRGFEGPIGALLVRRATAPDVVLAKGDHPHWISIYARSQRSGERISEASGPVARYGWHLLEHRWAWGQAPPGARELRRMLKVVIAIDTSYE